MKDIEVDQGIRVIIRYGRFQRRKVVTAAAQLVQLWMNIFGF